MTDSDIHARLLDWAQQYGGDQFRRLGYASPERLAHARAVEAAATPAAEIERITQRMERAGRWKESRVLHAEYFLAGLPEADRLQRLARIGLRMSRSAYYTYLNAARAYLHGALESAQPVPASTACPVP